MKPEAESVKIPHMKKIKTTVALVNDEQMQKLNRQHRGEDYLTDVLSFSLNEQTQEGVILLGEIVIDKDQAERQAQELGHSAEEEIAFLTAHAMMHLQGIHHAHY